MLPSASSKKFMDENSHEIVPYICRSDLAARLAPRAPSCASAHQEGMPRCLGGTASHRRAVPRGSVAPLRSANSLIYGKQRNSMLASIPTQPGSCSRVNYDDNVMG